jgi:hypothetical protein
MPIGYIVTLPHPRDDLVNYALKLLSTIDGTGYFVLHKDSNKAPVQRHIRNLLQGVNSRRDNLIVGRKWIDDIRLKSTSVYIYNRYSLADYTKPVTVQHIESFLELFLLYLGREGRLIFVDYGDGGEGSKLHCASELRNLLHRQSMYTSKVEEIVQNYLSCWTFSLDLLKTMTSKVLGPGRFDSVTLDNELDASRFLQELSACLAPSQASRSATVDLAATAQQLQRRAEALGGEALPYPCSIISGTAAVSTPRPWPVRVYSLSYSNCSSGS